MSKEKEKNNEPSPSAQLEQLRISQSGVSVVDLGDRKVKLRPITSAVSDRMSGYLVRQVDLSTSETPELIAKQKPNLKLQCKAVALAILNDNRMRGFFGWFKVNFLHWIYWRKIFWTYTSGDIFKVLTSLVEKLNLVFFYQNIALTKGMNSLERKKTKEEVRLSQAEQELVKKPDSLRNTDG